MQKKRKSNYNYDKNQSDSAVNTKILNKINSQSLNLPAKKQNIRSQVTPLSRFRGKSFHKVSNIDPSIQ